MKYFTKSIGAYKATATFYLHEPSKEIDPNRKYPVMVVVPGGAYFWTSDREAEPVALTFFAEDYHAVVINYSTEGLASYSDDKQLPINPVSAFPNPLIELAQVLAIIRENAELWSVKSNEITVLGFSAGGNLAAQLGVYWHEKWLSELVHQPAETFKPNNLVLAYAPLDFVNIHSDDGKVNYAALGVLNPNESELRKISPIYHVTENMPPCFLWHTTEDPLVSVENSLKMSAVLQKNKIPFELHLYQRGVHGAALGDSRTSRNSTQNNPQAASWVNLLLGWLDGDSESIDKS